MKIYEATGDDYSDVCAMFAELDRYHVPIDPSRVRVTEEAARSRDQYNDYICGDDRALFILEAEDAKVGFANVCRKDVEQREMQVARQYVLIDNFYICKRYRRRGYATQLYRFIQAWTRQQGISVIELVVYAGNTEAMQFYQSLGFSPYLHRMQVDIENRNEQS